MMKTKRACLVFACVLALAVPCAAVAATSNDANSADKTATTTKTEKASANKDTTSAKPAETASVVPSEELLAWAESNACETCHSDEAASLDNDKCMVSLHSGLGLACVDCHADDALIDIHAKAKADAKMPKKLKKSEVPAAVCASCHNTADLSKATVDSAVLTDEEGTVVNPHAIPDVEEHANITCINCHKMHTDKSVEKAAVDTCTNCHHENVYECYTCHS